MPSRRNAVRNPSFEVDGSHWSTAHGGTSPVPGFTRTNAWSQNGSNSALFSSFTVPASGFNEIISASEQVALPGQKWGAKAKVNVQSVSGSGRIVISVVAWNSVGGFLGQGLGPNMTSLGVQDLISNEYTLPASTAFVSVAVAVSTDAVSSGNVQFYIDSILLERTDVQSGFTWPTSYTYFDGSMAGFHWAGTAHASESVQDTLATAAMSDNVNMSSGIMRLQKASAALSGGSSMAGTPLRVRQAASAMRGDVAMAPSASRLAPVSAAMSDNVAMVPITRKIAPVIAAMSDDTSIMLPSLEPVFVTSAAMRADSSMSGSPSAVRNGSAHMSIDSAATATEDLFKTVSAEMSTELSMESAIEEKVHYRDDADDHPSSYDGVGSSSYPTPSSDHYDGNW